MPRSIRPPICSCGGYNGHSSLRSHRHSTTAQQQQQTRTTAAPQRWARFSARRRRHALSRRLTSLSAARCPGPPGGTAHATRREPTKNPARANSRPVRIFRRPRHATCQTAARVTPRVLRSVTARRMPRPDSPAPATRLAAADREVSRKGEGICGGGVTTTTRSTTTTAAQQQSSWKRRRDRTPRLQLPTAQQQRGAQQQSAWKRGRNDTPRIQLTTGNEQQHGVQGNDL